MYKKNPIKFVVLFFLFLISIISINSTSPNELDYIKLNIINEINFQASIKSDFSISKFDLNSYFLPQTFNGSQYLNNFTTSNNDYQLISDTDSKFLRFDYSNSLQKDNQLINNFILESTTTKPKINQKYTYPILKSEIDPIYYDYLEFEELVDLNQLIKNQASQLATGENDLFIISTKIANWITKDIEYDLKSVLENPNQKSTDVFNSKQGVCKEITNLFTSMMRSLGIPTRFVTGYAYTDSQELVEFVGSNWGGHVWAEVLIGDTWVPFDLTYNQYGYVDSTHIVTDKSAFIRNNGVSLDALSYGVQIVPNSLTLQNSFEIIDNYENLFDPGFDIKISGPEKLSFNSKGYVLATIENQMPYYQNIFLNFAKANEIELIAENERDNIYVFKPYEKKEIYFQYQVPQLDENFRYTFPFLIYNNFLNEKHILTVEKGFPKFETLNIPSKPQKQNFYTNNNLYYNCNYEILDNVQLTNLQDSNSNNNLDINCLIQNPNNFEINNLNLCLSDNNCKTLNLKINELVQVNFLSSKFENKLTANYNSITENIDLNFNYPTLSISHSSNYQNVEINSQILNYRKNLKLKLSLNDEIVFDNLVSEFETFKITTKPNYQKFKFEVYSNDLVFDEFETTLLIEKTPILTSIKNWFNKNLFKK